MYFKKNGRQWIGCQTNKIIFHRHNPFLAKSVNNHTMSRIHTTWNVAISKHINSMKLSIFTQTFGFPFVPGYVGSTRALHTNINNLWVIIVQRLIDFVVFAHYRNYRMSLGAISEWYSRWHVLCADCLYELFIKVKIRDLADVTKTYYQYSGYHMITIDILDRI